MVGGGGRTPSESGVADDGDLSVTLVGNPELCACDDDAADAVGEWGCRYGPAGFGVAPVVDGEAFPDVFHALDLGCAEQDEGCYIAPGDLEEMLGAFVFES